MIELDRSNKSIPYKLFYKLYDECILQGQTSPEAIVISTLNSQSNEVNSRFVNLKYILGEEWIFFSNYNSSKGLEIDSHDQISAVLYWHSIGLQVRIKAKIKKTSTIFSDEHFNKRTNEKNALAISSDQSKEIESYEHVKENFYKIINNKDYLFQRPQFWGGYSFIPDEFEFWQGHKSRLNKRESYIKKENDWKYIILQP